MNICAKAEGRSGGRAVVAVVSVMLLFASPLVGQIVVPEGDTLDIRIVIGTDTVRIVETDTLIVVETDTLIVTEVDTVYVEIPGEGCPNGWTCTPPISSYVFSLDALRDGRSGATSVVEGTYFRHLYRFDGVWNGFAEIAVPGVDSVVFVWNGSRNRERLYPYDVGGSGSAPSLLLSGAYILCWEVFGTDPDSACETVSITTQVGFRLPSSVPMKDGLMRQALFPLNDIQPISDFVATLNGQVGSLLPDNLGWYWLPVSDSGEISVTRSE